jgi:hypothetical protein
MCPRIPLGYPVIPNQVVCHLVSPNQTTGDPNGTDFDPDFPDHDLVDGALAAPTEREMCPWAISKYFGDLVSNTSA